MPKPPFEGGKTKVAREFLHIFGLSGIGKDLAEIVLARPAFKAAIQKLLRLMDDEKVVHYATAQCLIGYATGWWWQENAEGKWLRQENDQWTDAEFDTMIEQMARLSRVHGKSPAHDFLTVWKALDNAGRLAAALAA